MTVRIIVYVQCQRVKVVYHLAVSVSCKLGGTRNVFVVFTIVIAAVCLLLVAPVKFLHDVDQARVRS